MIDKDLSGVLFPNEKQNERQPDFRGNCLINGTKYKIAGWKKTSKNNLPYMSIAFQIDDGKPKQEKPKYTPKKAVEQVAHAVGGQEVQETIIDDEPLPF